jgi:predicted outer membrane repeat protein
MRPRSVPAGLPAFILIVSLALAGLVGVPAASAKTYRCMTINDRINTTYFWDVQAAIDDAEPGDTLWIRGYCFDTTLSIDKSLTLTGQDIPGFEPPRIHANRKGSVVHISGDIEVEINSLTLTGGGEGLLHPQAVDYGGGIRNEDSALTLNDVTITSNIAHWGGGVFNAGGDVVINDSTIEPNRAWGGGGGGIYTVGGTLTLRASRVADNDTAGAWGGGIYIGTENPITGTQDLTGAVVLSDTTIQGNTSNGRGGGIALRPSKGSLTLTDTTVQGNEAFGTGGGISSAGTATLTRTTIRDNYSDTRGGGIGVDAGTLTLTDSTVQSNRAERGGGLWSYGVVTLAGTSTLASNLAEHYGGGAYVDSGSHLTLTDDASIHHNSAGTAGGGIYAPTPPADQLHRRRQRLRATPLRTSSS